MPTALHIVHYHSSAQCTYHIITVYITTALQSVHYHSSTQCTPPLQYTLHIITVYITTAVQSVHYHVITVYITTVYITSLQCTLPQHARTSVCVCVRACVCVCVHAYRSVSCMYKWFEFIEFTFWGIIFSNCICKTLLYMCIEYCI